jgi:hypothetical protein
MNPVHPFIKKDHPAIPDSYGIKILYLDGSSEDALVAQHRFLKDTNIFEFVTKDDFWTVVPFSAIKKILFDKSFSKIVELKSQVKTPEQLKKEGV